MSNGKPLIAESAVTIVSQAVASQTVRPQKESLQDFQTRISQRIAQAQSQVSQDNMRLQLRVGEFTVFVPLFETAELANVPTLMPIALAQDWVLGLAVVRSEVLQAHIVL